MADRSMSEPAPLDPKAVKAAREAADARLMLWRSTDKYAHQYDAVACRQGVSVVVEEIIVAYLAALRPKLIEGPYFRQLRAADKPACIDCDGDYCTMNCSP